MGPPLTRLPPNLQGSWPGCHWVYVGSGDLDVSKGLHGGGKQLRLLEGDGGTEGQGGAVPGERQ